MEKLKTILARLDDLLTLRKYVDSGVIDFCGQGRNKYGK